MDFATLSKQVAEQDALEWIGLVTGILYVFLAAKEKPLCWVFGIISCACIAWKSFTDYKLIADGVLQVFYIVMGFIGLYQWVRIRNNNHLKGIIQSSWKQHVIAIMACLLFSIPFSWWLIEHAGARYGYLDTALTLLSVYATILLVRKDLHNWIYWIIIDIVYVGLYVKSDGLLFALLYLVYAAVAVWGFNNWKSLRKA
jgi:nicotinamide mononucleotide transporter